MYSTGANNAYFANKRKEEEEKKEQKKKYQFYMIMQEQKTRKEHARDMANVCPKCRMVKNYEGFCVMGCN